MFFSVNIFISTEDDIAEKLLLITIHIFYETNISIPIY